MRIILWIIGMPLWGNNKLPLKGWHPQRRILWKHKSGFPTNLSSSSTRAQWGLNWFEKIKVLHNSAHEIKFILFFFQHNFNLFEKKNKILIIILFTYYFVKRIYYKRRKNINFTENIKPSWAKSSEYKALCWLDYSSTRVVIKLLLLKIELS